MTLKKELLGFLDENRWVKGLKKYVVTTKFGFALGFYDDEEEAHAANYETFNEGWQFNIEAWYYPLLDDNTHGLPVKIPLKPRKAVHDKD